MIDLGSDLLLGVLLVLTCFSCGLVHQRLRALRTERGDLEAFVRALSETSERAEQAIAGLRAAAVEAEQRSREQGAQTQERAAELARLVESGERLARRLETGIGQAARAMAESGPARRHVAGPTHGTTEEARSAPTLTPVAATASPHSPPEALLRALETLR